MRLLAACHAVTHKHWKLVKDGIGTFAFCEGKLPRARVRVSFQPQGASARHWYGVPAEHRFSDGRFLLFAMLRADNPGHALTILNQAFAEAQPEMAGKWNG